MVRRIPKIYVARFESGAMEIHVPPSCSDEFKELVHRATNLWPDASPEIKAFADEVTNDGKLMQDYSNPSVTPQPKEFKIPTPAHSICLLSCTNTVRIETCLLSCPKHP